MSAAPAAVAFELKNLTVFSDGTTHRAAHDPPPLPACPSPTSPHAVATSDISLISSAPPAAGRPSPHARLFLPPAPSHKLPILLYFHGGGFIYGSCSLPPDHTFLCKLASHANILIVAVDYRLAPEHPLPAAYIDGLEALQWLKEQEKLQGEEEGGALVNPWLAKHGDFRRIFVGGDSAGANIAHHVAMAAGTGVGFEGGEERGGRGGDGSGRGKAKEEEVNVLQGVILIHPFFTCGQENGGMSTLEGKLWELSGVRAEHPYANPTRPEAPSLEGAPLPRIIVAVASKDHLAPCGLAFYKALVNARQLAKLFVSHDEDHVFHLLSPHSENVLPFLEELKDFISHP